MTAITASTATWGIPYATPATRLCDGYDAIDQMATAVDNLLVTFNADLDRIVTPPYASISTVVPQTVNTNVAGFAAPLLVIDYDTVNADTDNLTNLATLPSILTLPADVSPTGGYFAIFNQVMGFTGNTVNAGFIVPNVGINAAVADLGGWARGDDVNLPVGGTSAFLYPVSAAALGDVQIVGEMAAPNSGLPFATMVSSTFFALWVGDQ